MVTAKKIVKTRAHIGEFVPGVTGPPFLLSTLTFLVLFKRRFTSEGHLKKG